MHQAGEQVDEYKQILKKNEAPPVGKNDPAGPTKTPIENGTLHRSKSQNLQKV